MDSLWYVTMPLCQMCVNILEFQIYVLFQIMHLFNICVNIISAKIFLSIAFREIIGKL